MKKIVYVVLATLFSCANEQSPIEESSLQAIKEMEAINILESMDTIKLEMVIDDEESDLIVFKKPIDAYLYDPGTEPTNVRKTPKGEVMIQLHRVCDHELSLTGVDNGWFLVENIWGVENEDESYVDLGGYIHGSIIAVETRNYDDTGIKMFAEADENSELIITITEHTRLTLLSATEDGLWIKLTHQKNGKIISGWIQSEWLCGSAVTLCS